MADTAPYTSPLAGARQGASAVPARPELAEETEFDLFSTGENTEDLFMTFALGGEEYGVQIAAVVEIVGMQRIMGVPDLPDWIVGVINLRGKVIPLMCLRRRFGMELRAHDNRTVILVLQIDGAPIGLIVDRVCEVVEIPPASITAAAGLHGAGRSVVKALGRIGQRVVILLDPTLLLSDADLSVAPAEAAEVATEMAGAAGAAGG
jgi:purine-binding chemotaxis protein CheW